LYDHLVSGAEVVDDEVTPITVIALTSWITVPASWISACPVTFRGNRYDAGRMAANAAATGAWSNRKFRIFSVSAVPPFILGC